MVTGVANLRPRKVGLRCVGFNQWVSVTIRRWWSEADRVLGDGAHFSRNHAPEIAALFIRSDDRFAINSLTRFADHSAWPC